MEDEMSRIQMIKEQIIIYFSLSKRYNLDEIELPREKLNSPAPTTSKWFNSKSISKLTSSNKFKRLLSPSTTGTERISYQGKTDKSPNKWSYIANLSDSQSSTEKEQQKLI